MDAAVAFVSVSALIADLFLSDTNYHAVEADDITLFQFMSVNHLEGMVGSGEDFVSVHGYFPLIWDALRFPMAVILQITAYMYN